GASRQAGKTIVAQATGADQHNTDMLIVLTQIAADREPVFAIEPNIEHRNDLLIDRQETIEAHGGLEGLDFETQLRKLKRQLVPQNGFVFDKGYRARNRGARHNDDNAP